MKGFTLIEWMIVLAIVSILFAVAFGEKPAPQSATQCKSGYEFDRASGRQVIGANGGGIPCQTAPQ